MLRPDVLSSDLNHFLNNQRLLSLPNTEEPTLNSFFTKFYFQRDMQFFSFNQLNNHTSLHLSKRFHSDVAHYLTFGMKFFNMHELTDMMSHDSWVNVQQTFYLTVFLNKICPYSIAIVWFTCFLCVFQEVNFDKSTAAILCT